MRHVLSLLIISALLADGAAGQITPVSTKKESKVFTEYGQQRFDDYFWLSNPKDPAVIEHLNQENAYTAAMLKHTKGLQKTIYDELVARIEQKYESMPVKSQGYWYYTRYAEGKQYPLYCRKKETTAVPEEILLDVNALAAGHQVYFIRGYSVSPDGRWMAYGVDTSGNRRSSLFLKDLTSSAVSSTVISNTSGNYVWALDNKTLFYVLNDHTVRAYKVMRHTLGTDPASDVPAYAESDSTFGVRVSRTKDNAYLFIMSSSTLSDECRFIHGDRPAEPAVVIQPRQRDLLYQVRDYEGASFFLRTNKDAKNFKLVQTPATKPGLANWSDVIPHTPDALLEDAVVFKNYIVSQKRVKGLQQIIVFDRCTMESHTVDVGEEAYVLRMGAATDSYDLDSIRYSYSSLTSPPDEFRYDLASRNRILLKQRTVGGGYDKSLYETKRLWAKADDGVAIPVSIVYRRSMLKKDGSNPLYLYAYGSYGATMDPDFNRWVISLLDRGFVYGIAHVRGGQEMGRQWYDDGKVLRKKNTFTDYLACARLLVNQKYTSSDRLFANGVSAGGMLMGAIVNMAPELFRGVIAEVPWTDVITDMMNADLPLTTLEYDEWGNPTKKEEYDYMRSWSPYDNMKKSAYPAIFATGGLNDTQVPYFSPAKWVARLRELNTGSSPVLFKCNMGAGHSGESGRFESQKLTAMKYAFLIDLAGGGKRLRTK